MIAVKPGSLYPEKQIIIGGHFDAVPDCPGADDNGTGTAATLEIARVLSQYENEMTIIFIAFDSEESWMWGSYYYVEQAELRGDDIVFMMNIDMIGHYTNSGEANVYAGVTYSYADLWASLSSSENLYTWVQPVIASDNLPFYEAGIESIFVQERNFSTEYHQPSDSTTYIDFEYMTRMTKVCLATYLHIDAVPPPITNLRVQQFGNGVAMHLTWDLFNNQNINSYRIIYQIEDMSLPPDTIQVPASINYYTVNGLTTGVSYNFSVEPVDLIGQTPYKREIVSGTPYILPGLPNSVSARPAVNGIRLTWERLNIELDFSHFAVYRDNQEISQTIEYSYFDNDPSLGNDLHAYRVVSVDTDGFISDTTGVEPAFMKAATLEPGRVLAINRTSSEPGAFVDEAFTGQFLREALVGLNFDYRSDSAYSYQNDGNKKLNILDFIDYSLVCIAAEGNMRDDIGGYNFEAGILDTIADYFDLGGRVIIFGNWGLNFSEDYNTYIYPHSTLEWADAYHDYFHIAQRVLTPSVFNNPIFEGDMIGAHSQDSGYPKPQQGLSSDGFTFCADPNCQYNTISIICRAQFIRT